jgi:hypothetical protein
MRMKRTMTILAAAVMLAGFPVCSPVQAQGPGVLAITVVTTFTFKLTSTKSTKPANISVIADTLDEAWTIMSQLIGMAKLDAKAIYSVTSVDQTYTP